MINSVNTANTQLASQASTPEAEIFNQIKRSGNTKEQLRKVASEFEAIFASQLLSKMDQTVEHDEDGVFGGEGEYMKTFKSFIFDEMGREIAKNPKTSLGFASQIYKQMEKSIGE